MSLYKSGSNSLDLAGFGKTAAAAIAGSNRAGQQILAPLEDMVEKSGNEATGRVLEGIGNTDNAGLKDVTVDSFMKASPNADRLKIAAALKAQPGLNNKKEIADQKFTDYKTDLSDRPKIAEFRRIASGITDAGELQKHMKTWSGSERGFQEASEGYGLDYQDDLTTRTRGIETRKRKKDTLNYGNKILADRDANMEKTRFVTERAGSELGVPIGLDGKLVHPGEYKFLTPTLDMDEISRHELDEQNHIGKAAHDKQLKKYKLASELVLEQNITQPRNQGQIDKLINSYAADNGLDMDEKNSLGEFLRAGIVNSSQLSEEDNELLQQSVSSANEGYAVQLKQLQESIYDPAVNENARNNIEQRDAKLVKWDGSATNGVSDGSVMGTVQALYPDDESVGNLGGESLVNWLDQLKGTKLYGTDADSELKYPKGKGFVPTEADIVAGLKALRNRSLMSIDDANIDVKDLKKFLAARVNNPIERAKTATWQAQVGNVKLQERGIIAAKKQNALDLKDQMLIDRGKVADLSPGKTLVNDIKRAGDQQADGKIKQSDIDAQRREIKKENKLALAAIARKKAKEKKAEIARKKKQAQIDNLKTTGGEILDSINAPKKALGHFSDNVGITGAANYSADVVSRALGRSVGEIVDGGRSVVNSDASQFVTSLFKDQSNKKKPNKGN